MQKTKELAV